jgi:PA domain.
MKNKLFLVPFIIASLFIYAPGVFAAPSNGNPFAGDKLYQDMVYYTHLGEHRTATAVDHATAYWLSSRLKDLGFSVEMMPYATNQFYPKETSVTIDKNIEIEAFPVWWPKFTEGEGQTGKITADLNDVNGKIFLFDNPSMSVTQDVQTKINTATANGATGVIVILTSSVTPSQEIYGQNAQQQISYGPAADPGAGDQTSWKIPVVTVGRKDRPALQKAIDRKLDVNIKSTGFMKADAISYVVIGTLDRGPASKTMIVSTPSSGWFDDAGERGTGIAIWLALANWAAKDTSGVKWVFMSSSGHEIDYRGTNMWLKSASIPRPKDVYLWTHLGANLMTYNYAPNPDGTLRRTNQTVKQVVRYATTNQSVIDAMKSSFLPINPQAEALGIKGIMSGGINGGDLFLAKWHGYSNLMYFVAMNPTFHTRQDTEDISGPELLEPMAVLIKSTLQRTISEF